MTAQVSGSWVWCGVREVDSGRRNVAIKRQCNWQVGCLVSQAHLHAFVLLVGSHVCACVRDTLPLSLQTGPFILASTYYLLQTALPPRLLHNR